MKLLKTLLFGFAAGATATYFLKTKHGQAIKEKCLQEVESFKANPVDYQEKAKEKVLSYKDLAVSRFHDYKKQLDTDGVPTEQVFNTLKEKADDATELLQTKKDDLLDQQEKLVDNIMAKTDDIVIDYTESVLENKTHKEN